MEKIYKGEIQRLLPIFQAMADGMVIQFSENGNDWIDIDGEEEGLFLDTLIDNPQYYRIKPEPKYRPFNNEEECWAEMQKHQPFGWLKSKEKGYYTFITMLNYRFRLNGYDGWRFDDVINKFTFADGTTFGVKEDK